jgi:hypothetical protein
MTTSGAGFCVCCHAIAPAITNASRMTVAITLKRGPLLTAAS